MGRPLRAAFVQGACGCLKAPAGHPGTSKRGKIIWNDFLWFKGTRSSLQLACCYSGLRQEPLPEAALRKLCAAGRLLLLGAFDQPSPCKLLKNNSCWEKPGLRERKGPFLSFPTVVLLLCKGTQIPSTEWGSGSGCHWNRGHLLPGSSFSVSSCIFFFFFLREADPAWLLSPEG